MAVSFNHTIVHARDAHESATFTADILGLAPPGRFGPFLQLDLANGVSLDYLSTDEDFLVEHYAFLISEAEFDEVFARIEAGGVPYWADPGATRPQQINHGDGGRGCYFDDPSGHRLEVLTRPYGSSGL